MDLPISGREKERISERDCYCNLSALEREGGMGREREGETWRWM
jgi:hypothetical protein